MLNLLLCCLLLLPHGCERSQRDTIRAELRVDGSKEFQQIDGIGVNVNTRSWSASELEDAIALLQDDMNAVIWRVLVETVEGWEEENDDNDPFHFNWEYYDKLYETPKFRKAWDMIAYLNKRGITDKLMINFMGVIPKWMGEEVVLAEFEEEYIEMLASFFYYGIKKKGVQIGLVSHMNEPDLRLEGPTVSAGQYASIFSRLVRRMQQVGLDHIRFVGPDVARMDKGISEYVPEMMQDKAIMQNLEAIGLHSYSGYYAPVDSMIGESAYPDSKFWITEWNEWCNSCDEGKRIEFDYDYASMSARHLIDFLSNGASSCVVWEGYDSYYEHHAPSPFSYWGVLEFNRQSRTYHPRKQFYTIAQISGFLTPGSVRIGSATSDKHVLLIATRDSHNRINILGVNVADAVIELDVTLENLPEVEGFRMSYTNDSANLAKRPDIRANDGRSAGILIPPKSVFALTSF
ncbi:MAG TPA: hypothetical protein VKZ75_10505 [Cyclobacteriaceae bacterium]|nr:hypothetical protein [Cyclobacteriaceae bacterium]